MLGQEILAFLIMEITTNLENFISGLDKWTTLWNLLAFFFFFRSYLFNNITCCFLFERRLNTFFYKFLAQIIRLDSWYFKALLENNFCVLNKLMTVTQSLDMKVNEKIKSLAKVVGCLEINNSDLRLTYSIWHHSLKFAAHYLEMNHSSGIVRKFYEKCKACFLGNFDEKCKACLMGNFDEKCKACLMGNFDEKCKACLLGNFDEKCKACLLGNFSYVFLFFRTRIVVNVETPNSSNHHYHTPCQHRHILKMIYSEITGYIQLSILVKVEHHQNIV